MRVLLDSNIYKHELTLDGGQFRLLFSQASQGRFQLVLPEVVAREVSELYRREIDQKLRELRKAARRLRSLGIPTPEPESIDAEILGAEFRALLESKVVGSGGELRPLPELPHDLLVDKAIHKRRPFSGKGDGYRDALIWQTVLELSAEGEIVTLITDNYTDFAEADGQTLHADLIAELEAAGSDPGSVRLYRTLESFLKASVPVEEAALQRVRDLLLDESTLAGLKDSLATVLDQLPLPDEGRGFLAGLNVEAEGAWIETLDDLRSIEAVGAYGLADDAFSVELEAAAAVTVDFLAYKGDLFVMNDLGDEVDLPFRVYDYDYNDRTAAAEAPIDLTLSIRATFHSASGELGDVEVSDISQAEYS